MQRRIRWLVLAITSWALLAASPAQAAEPEVLTFLNDQALSLTVTAGATEATFSVDVVNGDTARRTITIRLVDTTLNGTAAAIPGAADPLGSIGVDPGDTDRFDVTLRSDTPYNGKYAGRLVATDGAGHIARRDFLMSAAAPVAESPAPGVLAAPLPAELLLTATRRCPTPLNSVCLRADEVFGIPGMPVAPDLAGVMGSVPLSGPDSVAQLSVKDGHLTVIGIAAAAEYKGKITIGTGDTKQETAVRLVVTDLVLYPLLLLLAGLWSATRIEDFFKYRRPLADLRIALEADKRRAREEQDRLTKWLTDAPQPAWPVDARTAVRIYDATVPSLLGDEADRALREFKKSESADERDKRWGLIGSERTRLAKLVDRLEILGRLAPVLSDEYQQLTTRIGRDVAARTPAVRAAVQAWSGEVLPPHADFEAREKTMTSSVGFVERLLNALILVDQIAQLAVDKNAAQTLRDSIADVREQLLGPSTTSVEVVSERETSVRKLETDVLAAATSGRVDTSGYVSPVPALSHVEPLAEELQDLALDRRLSVQLANQEFRYNIAAAIFVVLSGLAALYFTKASFGTIGDYLGVFLWGIGVGEVVKLLPRLPLLRTS
jgi:hypothetical protein